MPADFTMNSKIFIEMTKNMIQKATVLRAIGSIFAYAVASFLFSGCFEQAAPKRDITSLSIADAYEKRDSVEFINLSGATDIDALRQGVIGEFPALKKLSLRGLVEVDNIPFSAGVLSKVTYLDIASTGIKSVPEDMKALQYLYMSDNKLSGLQLPFSKLDGLVYLNLDRNELTNMPEEIGNLVSLKWLRLNNNILTSLPASSAKFGNIRRLYLRENKFTEFPKEILSMSSLEELDIGGNMIKSIPDEIVNMPNLKRIDLDGNPIQKLPPDIGNMKNLTHLFINNCKISEEERKRIRTSFPDKVRVHIAF